MYVCVDVVYVCMHACVSMSIFGKIDAMYVT
jgi:hypothetical protein